MGEKKCHKTKTTGQLFLLSFLILSHSGFSQRDTLKDRTELFDVYFSAGSVAFPVFSMSQESFKKIVPHSQILSGDIMKVNFNDFNNDSAGGLSVGNGKNAVYAQIGITLKLKNKEFKNAGPWLKLGLSYFSSSAFLSTGVFRNKVTNADSLYYVNALPVSRVTTNRQSVTYQYSCQSINLESTLIYRLNPSGIFSLFGGPGAFLGLNFAGRASLISTTEITMNDYLFGRSNGSVLYANKSQKSETIEVFSLKPNLSFGLFINIGVDMRLGNKYAVIKNTHLFAELKPMFRGYGVKGAGIQGSVILVGNLGLRYEFD